VGIRQKSEKRPTISRGRSRPVPSCHFTCRSETLRSATSGRPIRRARRFNTGRMRVHLALLVQGDPQQQSDSTGAPSKSSSRARLHSEVTPRAPSVRQQGQQPPTPFCLFTTVAPSTVLEQLHTAALIPSFAAWLFAPYDSWSPLHIPSIFAFRHFPSPFLCPPECPTETAASQRVRRKNSPSPASVSRLADFCLYSCLLSSNTIACHPACDSITDIGGETKRHL
jgi:hypothetical protein